MGVNKVFIRNVKKFRKNAGISQEKLAELCQSAHSYIRQIECGSRYPSFLFIEKLAAALNVAPYLLFYDEEMDKFGISDKLSVSETELLEIVSKDIHRTFDNLRVNK